MTCPSCQNREMEMIRFVSAGGKDGSVATWTYRCRWCGCEETVEEPRKAA